MIEEAFTDGERQLLMVFVTDALVRHKDDPDMKQHIDECFGILRRLNGTDTVIIARRAYPSGADRE